MNKKMLVLFSLSIVMICFMIFIIYLKVDDVNLNKDNNNSEPIINNGKKLLSVWGSSRKYLYDGEKLISDEKVSISLKFYEDTVEVCVRAEDNMCDEINYTDNGGKLIISDSSKISFSGTFKKNESTDFVMMLEQTLEDGNRVVYKFNKPMG